MDSTLKLLLALSVFVALLLATGLAITSQDIGKENQRYKAEVGTEVILKGDTLMVVDYSLWDDTFTLENGVSVSSKLVFDE